MTEWDNLISDMRDAAKDMEPGPKRQFVSMLKGWLEELESIKEDGDDGRGGD